jgi:hypothetical protein
MSSKRRGRRVGGGLIAVVVVTLVIGAAGGVAVAGATGTRVDGTLLLANHKLWNSTGGHACAGVGVYADAALGSEDGSWLPARIRHDAAGRERVHVPGRPTRCGVPEQLRRF